MRTQAKTHEKHIKEEIFWVLFLRAALLPRLLEEIGRGWEGCGECIRTGSFVVDFNLLNRQILFLCSECVGGFVVFI